MELITIICEVAEFIDDAIDVLSPFISEHEVTSVRPYKSRRPALECSVTTMSRPALIAALDKAGFRVVESGQE